MRTEKKLVALCTSRIYDPQVHDYIQKINDALVQENCVLLIYTINADQYWDEDNLSAETAVFDMIPYDRVDVILLMDEKIKSRTISQRIIRRAGEYGTPVIVVDGQYEGTTYIKFDYARGFEQVVRHVFAKKDVKNPHIMAGFKDNPFSDERIEVFKKVIGEYGFTFDATMLSYGDFWAKPAIDAMEQLIAVGNIPDALFCANDIMAINVCDVLKSHHYQIPEEIMVTGFDGYEEIFITEPRITSALCTTPELAGASVEMVKKIISGQLPDPGPEDSILVCPTLLPNESTGDPTYFGYDPTVKGRFNDKFYRHQDAVRIMHEVTTDMQMSHDAKEMISYLERMVINDRNMTENLSFALNRKLLDIEDYYFDQEVGEIDLDLFSYVYDSSVSSDIVKTDISDSLLRPDHERFWKKVADGFPLIYNTLDYMDKVLGYICFHYNDYDITRYSRTSDVTNCISMGIGGFVNMAYQRSLTDKINEIYKRDGLTGLYNRMGFNKAFGEWKRDKGLYGSRITVLMTDLDRLKYTNDHFGHDEGDNAIVTTANAMKAACPEDALCVRYGGDELFALVIGDYDGEQILNRIDDILAAYNRSSEKPYEVTASCGSYTTVFDQAFDLTRALREADERMYGIKKLHRAERGADAS